MLLVVFGQINMEIIHLDFQSLYIDTFIHFHPSVLRTLLINTDCEWYAVLRHKLAVGHLLQFPAFIPILIVFNYPPWCRWIALMRAIFQVSLTHRCYYSPVKREQVFEFLL